MMFSGFASDISPFISFGKFEYEYFIELVCDFVQDSATDSCMLLKRKSYTKYRYIKGDCTIKSKDAQYLYDYRDKYKFHLYK